MARAKMETVAICGKGKRAFPEGPDKKWATIVFNYKNAHLYWWGNILLVPLNFHFAAWNLPLCPWLPSSAIKTLGPLCSCIPCYKKLRKTLSDLATNLRPKKLFEFWTIEKCYEHAAQQKSQINDRERLYRLRRRDVAVTSATVPSFERKVSADEKMIV